MHLKSTKTQFLLRPDFICLYSDVYILMISYIEVGFQTISGNLRAKTYIIKKTAFISQGSEVGFPNLGTLGSNPITHLMNILSHSISNIMLFSPYLYPF